MDELDLCLPERRARRFAAGALLALGLLGCASHEVERVAPVDANTNCDLVGRVEAATRADDPRVRRGAVYLLGRRGPPSSLAALGPAIHDTDPFVRQAAIQSICNLGASGGEEGLATRYLLEAAELPWWSDRDQALLRLGFLRPSLAPAEAAALRRRLDDEAGNVQIAAGLALLRAGLGEGLEPRVVQWIDQYSCGGLDSRLAELLDCIQDPSHIKSAENLFDSHRADVRHTARVAYARLEGAPQRWQESEEIERAYSETNAAATRALFRAKLESVPRSAVLERVHEARLVLFGEMHHGPGPTRDAQMDLLRAFVRNPELEALGYEPSVQSAQQSVLDLAEALHLRVIPLETRWEDLCATGRSGARDVEAGEMINAFLAENPAHRMFVIRGESHALPNGFLVRRLHEVPLILLSVHPIPLCIGGLTVEGSTFRLVDFPNTWWLGCEDEAETVFPELLRWLGSR